MSQTTSNPVSGSGILDPAGNQLNTPHTEERVEALVQYAKDKPVTTAICALVIGYILGKIF
jgi:hypothetical protein